MKKPINLDELPTLAELNFRGILNQSSGYFFEEIDGKLVAIWREDVDYAFIVGDIEHRGTIKVVKHDGWIVARDEGDGWEFVDRDLDLASLKTIDDLDIDGILSQSSQYAPGCFQEFDGYLVAMWDARWENAPKHAFIVGPIERCGFQKVVRHNGRIIALDEWNTGWGFVPQEDEVEE